MNVADWLTAILTPVTFGLVLLAELRYRRANSGVVLWLDWFDSDLDKFHHSIKIMNVGSDAATMVAIYTTAIPDQVAKVAMLRPGEDREMVYWSDRISQDWLLIAYVNALDNRFIVFDWLPLNPSGPLFAIWTKQRRQHIRGRSRFFGRRRKPQQVGPGAGVARTWVRRTSNHTNRDMKKAMNLFYAAQSVRTLQIEKERVQREQNLAARSGRLTKLYKRVLRKVRS